MTALTGTNYIQHALHLFYIYIMFMEMCVYTTKQWAVTPEHRKHMVHVLHSKNKPFCTMFY